MKRQELYINGQLVDLGGENALPLRLKTIVTDANNPDARGGTFTYTIRLMMTRRNAAVFEHIDLLQAIDTFNRGQGYAVEYYVDSFLELVGLLIVRSVAPDGYVEGEIYSDDIAWATQIDDKSLRDIKSLGTVPFTGVFGTRPFNYYLARGIDATPLQFPMVSYGNYFHGPAAEGKVSTEIFDQAFDDFPPAAYYLRVFRAIFLDIGWTVKGKIFDDPDLRAYVMPYVGQQSYRWNWATMGYARFTHTPTAFTLGQNHALAYAGSALGGAYTAKTDELYRVRLSVGYTRPSTSTGDVTFVIAVEVVSVSGTVDGTFSASSTAAPGDTVGLVAEGEITLTVGQRLRPVYNTSSDVFTSAEFEVTLPLADTDINVAANLPDMNQKVFVKSFISFFNLFFDASPENKVITFYQEGDYYREPDFVVRLDDVVDVKKAKKVPPRVFRKLDFVYTPDGDDALAKGAPDFANHRITNSQPAAQGQSAVLVPFAPTVYRDYLPQPGGAPLSLPTLADREALDTPLKEVDWRFNYVPRIIKFLGPVAVPFLINGQASNIGLSEFPEGLKWKNLYATYYNNRPQNPRGHLLECAGILHKDQHHKLRQKFNVLLDGEIYRLASMDGYDPLEEEETKLILIKQA